MLTTISPTQQDSHWMRHALNLAQKAESAGEVPIGAAVVFQEKLIAESFNQPIQLSDPCAHAEILALRRAGEVLKNYRLVGCTLYVTVEPCMMCMGAIIHSRIDRLVVGALDPKAGCLSSQLQIDQYAFLNHKPLVTTGVLAEESAELLRTFFKKKR